MAIQTINNAEQMVRVRQKLNQNFADLDGRIVYVAEKYSLPSLGDAGVLYAVSSGADTGVYRWDETAAEYLPLATVGKTTSCTYYA